jgi:phage-related minor tail protein
MNAADQIMANFAQSAAQNIQSAFAEFLFDPFKGGLKGMLSSFLDVTRRMLAELAAQQILGAIFGSFTGGKGFMASFAKAITGRASGGPVSANRPYIVGERGPELFVPGSSGGIVPNHAMMGGGMTVAPVYNIDARGATADLQSALPGILQENNRRIFEELDRRYGVGR